MLHRRIPFVILFLFTTLGLVAQPTTNSRSVVIGSNVSKPNAILYLNPENKDQGFLLPQLTTTQRLAIPATSPADDGLMVFDKDLKDVFLWKNNAWASSTIAPVDNSITNETINKLQLLNNELRITEGATTVTQNMNALTLAGDVSGALNSSSVSKMQGNPINNAKLSVVDNGKFLVWDGTQWKAQTISALNTTQFYTIDPSAFTILKPDGKADKHNMTIFETDDSFVTIHSRAEGGTVIAPLNLPHGATIKNVVLHYMDREAANIQIRILRKMLGASNEELVNWTSTGNSAAVRTQTFNAFNGLQVVDNNTYTYRVEVALNPTAAANKPSDASHRVYGVKFEYLP